MFSAKAVAETQGLILEKVRIFTLKRNIESEIDILVYRLTPFARHSKSKVVLANPPTSSGPSAA
jgi:hypothetical protein